ncbi:uncharacterized protein VTP21DRAFT_4385 [Calcarisporiella thermophila]|uniref:uncharacterized protein n=1 Tax=Calcarisporiella thermophila TaxID=911321 RepID=UPI003741F506
MPLCLGGGPFMPPVRRGAAAALFTLKARAKVSVRGIEPRRRRETWRLVAIGQACSIPQHLTQSDHSWRASVMLIHTGFHQSRCMSPWLPPPISRVEMWRKQWLWPALPILI